jgi:hypothetical protein
MLEVLSSLRSFSFPFLFLFFSWEWQRATEGDWKQLSQQRLQPLADPPSPDSTDQQISAFSNK